MPLYDYRCPNGHTFEVFHRMSDPPVERCQECGAAPVEKVLYPVAVHFKGSGFYSTDYGRGSRKGAGKDGDSASEKSEKSEQKETPASGGSGGGDTGSSAKPEKKSD